LQQTGTYFPPFDFKTLAEILCSFPDRNFDEEIYEPYERRMKNAAEQFLEILSN
jgi:hypothetical protein